MKEFVSTKVVAPLLALLKQGVTPTKLSLALTLGLLITIFPAFGTHSFLCLFVIWAFRMNPAAVFLVNQVAYPVMFFTYLPLIRMGEFIFQQPPLTLSITEIFDLFVTDFPAAMVQLWWSTLFAVAAWALVSVPLGYLLFLLLRALFTKFLKSPSSENEAPATTQV